MCVQVPDPYRARFMICQNVGFSLPSFHRFSSNTAQETLKFISLIRIRMKISDKTNDNQRTRTFEHAMQQFLHRSGSIRVGLLLVQLKYNEQVESKRREAAGKKKTRSTSMRAVFLIVKFDINYIQHPSKISFRNAWTEHIHIRKLVQLKQQQRW